MSLEMSFGIHKSSFSLFTALKSTTYSQILSKLKILEMNESGQLQVTGDHQSVHIRQFFTITRVLQGDQTRLNIAKLLLKGCNSISKMSVIIKHAFSSLQFL